MRGTRKGARPLPSSRAARSHGRLRGRLERDQSNEKGTIGSDVIGARVDEEGTDLSRNSRGTDEWRFGFGFESGFVCNRNLNVFFRSMYLFSQSLIYYIARTCQRQRPTRSLPSIDMVEQRHCATAVRCRHRVICCRKLYLAGMSNC